MLYTDHKPLTSALFRSSPPWTSRQQRHLAYIAEFTSSIVHVPGPENVVADALSRPSPALAPLSPSPPRSKSAPPLTVLSPVSPVSPPLLRSSKSSHIAPNPHSFRDSAPEVSEVSAVSDPQPSSMPSNQSISQDFSIPGFNFSELLSLQKSCSSVQTMKKLSSLSIVNIPLDSGDILICDNSTGNLRPLVPTVLRKPVFLALHNISHPGVRGSRRFCLAWFSSRCWVVGQVLSPVSTE